jgi:hypothetical protein
MLGKNKVFDTIWEGSYLFVGYVDEKEMVESDERGCICIIKGFDEDQWQKDLTMQRDLQLFYPRK